MDRYTKCYFFDKHDIERAEVIKPHVKSLLRLLSGSQVGYEEWPACAWEKSRALFAFSRALLSPFLFTLKRLQRTQITDNEVEFFIE